MTGFDRVAIVNLLEDYGNKDYGFALYESDYLKLHNSDLVVVNARRKDNRILGVVKEIISVKEYGKSVTAQVVGVVDMSAYNARIIKENRLKEIAKKKDEIEKELNEEISKRKTIEYYEKMAIEYADNSKIAELVMELKNLEL